jgi:hypothetical protein
MARILGLSPVANPGMHHLAAFLRGLLGMMTKYNQISLITKAKKFSFLVIDA